MAISVRMSLVDLSFGAGLSLILYQGMNLEFSPWIFVYAISFILFPLQEYFEKGVGYSEVDLSFISTLKDTGSILIDKWTPANVVFGAIKAFISLIALIKQIVNQIREDDDPEPGFDGYFLPE
jgi:hypothetical protein